MSFLSTLSLRRATRRSVKLFRQNYISIHALLAESDIPYISVLVNTFLISIHALLAESDSAFDVLAVSALLISIHALLAESDLLSLLCDLLHDDFYPRSPCGERHDTSSLMQCQVKFLSTLSLRRATRIEPFQVPGYTISIHALLAESDTR